MKKIKKYEELTLKDDFMFGIIMRNPKYCKTFLETILGVRIKRIEYPQAQKTIDISLSSKSVRLDIFVEDDRNTVYNVEMQTVINENIPKRSRYYQSMIDLNILEKGSDYRQLKKSFVIFICTFDLFGKGRHIYTFENRCIQELSLPLGDETTKIILNTKGTANDVSDDMKSLLNYIDGQLPSDAYTTELDAAVKSARHNERWRHDYMTLEMIYQEKYEQGEAAGYKRGIECGIEKGLEQGALQNAEQTAISMLRDGDLSLDKIAKYTNISLEQLKTLQTMLDMAQPK